jgi:Chaperone of endosialidase
MRIFTGKCAISQTGSGSGYWQVGVTNFNDPGGQFDATEILAGDFLIFTDSGDFYQLEVTEVVSASGSNATIKVSNVGVTGISSVPTTTNAAVTRGSTNYQLIPWIANLSGNENQLFTEDLMVKIDTAIDDIAGGGGGPTNLTFSGASTPYTLNSSTGTDVTFAAGSGVTLSRVGDELTISASGGGSTNLTFTGTNPVTLNSDTGTDVTFTQGTNIALTRSGNNLTIAAPSVVTSVTDQINGLDITNNSGVITIAPNIPELTSLTSFDALDEFMVYDSSAVSHKRAAMGTYLSNGFVDKTNNQVDIGGDKGFTTSLHYGAATLPTGSAFGTTVDTVFSLKGGTGDVTEANFADFGGLIIKTVYQAGTDDNTTKFIATGKDTNNDAGAFKFYTRDNQIGSNWVQGLHIYNTSSQTVSLFGNADTSSQAPVCVPSTGIGISSAGTAAYKFATINSPTQTFQLIQDGGFLVAYCDESVTSWKDPSDERLKYNIETLNVLDNIENLRGVSFNIKNGDKPHVGVIAQEIEKAFPQIVSEGPDGMKGVSYSAVGAIALQGVKELHEENKLLKEQIRLLSNRLDRLENI